MGRAFAASEVSGPDSLTRALTPSIMEMIGRSLIRTGELVLLIDTSGGSLRLVPAQTHDVEGGPDPSTWEYRLSLGGPSRSEVHEFVPSAGVLHFRYAADPSTPFRGNSPIAVAHLAGRLSAETIRALADEASGPVGRLLGVPTDGEDASVSGLKSDISSARGRTAIVEGGDWGRITQVGDYESYVRLLGWKDNVFVERLWKSVKYEEVYLRAYESVPEARTGLGRYFEFYNAGRPHSSLGGMTPDQFFDRAPAESAAA